MTAQEQPQYAGAVDAHGERVIWVDVDEITTRWRPGSAEPPWTWDDEARDLGERVCVCCNERGHYQQALEAHIAEHGMPALPVCLGNDGRVWDGHHRIVAARRLQLQIPVELEHLLAAIEPTPPEPRVPLWQLAAGIAEHASTIGDRFGVAAAAQCDQLFAMARDNLRALDVDIDDQVAARALLAVYEIAVASHRAAGGARNVNVANAAVANVLTAAATVTASRHCNGARP